MKLDPVEVLCAEMHYALEAAGVDDKSLRSRAVLRIARAYERYWTESGIKDVTAYPEHVAAARKVTEHKSVERNNKGEST